jgi:threonine aldolase
MKAIREYSLSENIPMHLDGARLWNASVASSIPVREYARYFDSVSVCFSKGLGAPVGSMIVGSKSFIEDARKYRKIFGGGMRQAGILAAAALYAIEHNVNRLADDHRNAKMFGGELTSLSQLKVNASDVQTNMIFIEIIDRKLTQAGVLALLKEHGVLLTPERHSEIRAVTHLDVSESEVLLAASIIKKLFS